jgi:hypothetical protein
MFLGTPFKGSGAVNAAKIRVQIAKFCFGEDTNDALLEKLEKDSETMDAAVQDFAHLIHNSCKRIKLYFYYETQPTDMRKAAPGLLGYVPFIAWLFKLRSIVSHQFSMKLLLISLACASRIRSA